MNAQEREAMRLAYNEIHKLVNSGAVTSQSTIDACVALRQAMTPPRVEMKLRKLWESIIQKRQRDETW
jgi:hypothetical protein